MMAGGARPGLWLRRVCAVVGRSVNAVLMGVVRAYRFFLSPWLGSACRFTPTCSQYALQALERHGPRRAVTWLPAVCCVAIRPVPVATIRCPIGRRVCFPVIATLRRIHLAHE